MKSADIEEMDGDTCFIMQEILSDEIDDSEFIEFAIENLIEGFNQQEKTYSNFREG